MLELNSFRQNWQLRINQRRFYHDLEEGANVTTETPDKNETTKFWSNIWDKPKEHNKDAVWIEEAEIELKGQNMENLSITVDMVRKQAKKMKNWTAPGKDEVHGYWLKYLTELHNRLAQQMNTLL